MTTSLTPLLRTHHFRCLPILVCSFYIFSAQAVLAQRLDFAQALALAETQASSLKAQSASMQAARALEPAAAELPNPRLNLGVDNLPIARGDPADHLSLTRDFMTMRQIGWTQDMPNSAKRAARNDMAQARTAREAAVLNNERLVVRREAGLAWLASYFAQTRLALLSSLELENQLLQDTTAARLASGKTLSADALLARQEALTLADRRDELTRQVTSSRASLRRWVGTAVDMPLATEVPFLTVDSDALRQQLTHQSDLAAYAPMLALAEAETREAEAAKTGDWSWGVTYSKRGPAFTDMLSVQLSFELPLRNAQRQDPQIAAKQQEAERIEAQRDDLLKRITESLTQALAEDAELQAKRQRLQTQALPLAQQRIDLLLSSYQAGRAELGAVLAARKELLELRLRSVDLQAQQAALRLGMNTRSDASLNNLQTNLPNNQLNNQPMSATP